MHDGSHIGTECPDCGTHHRVLESLDASPMTRAALESLEDGETIILARGIAWMSPGLAGVEVENDEPPHDEVTEDIVLGTQTKALLLSLYDPGWVVEMEIEPEEDETVKEVAQELWINASNDLSQAMQNMMG